MCKKNEALLNFISAHQSQQEILSSLFTQVSFGVLKFNFSNESNSKGKKHEGGRREKPKPQFNLQKCFGCLLRARSLTRLKKKPFLVAKCIL